MQQQVIKRRVIQYHNQDGSVKQVQISPENKQYLILLYFVDDTVEKTFEFITGRDHAYNYIKEKADEIDPLKSMILVTGVKLEDINSVRDFMLKMSEYFNDGFNIDEYVHPEDLKSLALEDNEEAEILNHEAIGLLNIMNSGQVLPGNDDNGTYV